MASPSDQPPAPPVNDATGKQSVEVDDIGQRIQTARDMFDGVHQDTLNAICLNKLYERCAYHDDIPSRFQSGRKGHGFIAVRTGLQMQVILTLGRIYDDSSRASRINASLPHIMNILDDGHVLEALKKEFTHIDNEVDYLAATEEGTVRVDRPNPLKSPDRVESEIDDAIKRVRATYNLVRGRHELSRLRSFRHTIVAHRALDLKDLPAQELKNENIQPLLERTIKLVEELHVVLHYAGLDIGGFERGWTDLANVFWTHASNLSGPSTKQE